MFWLNDLIVVKHLSWPLLLSLVEYLRGVVPVDRRHIVISATEGHVILNDPVWETVGLETVRNGFESLLVSGSVKVLSV